MITRDLERAAAKMFCVGFDGTSVTPTVRRLIERGVSGVVLFGRNIESAKQVATLCADLKSIAGRPVLICDGVVQGSTDLSLRPPEPFDPPILMALPLLLNRMSPLSVLKTKYAEGVG